MGIGYRIDEALGLTVVVWDGAVTGDEAEDHVRSLRAEPDWPPGRLHLLDATSVTSVPRVRDTKLVEMLGDIAEWRRIRFAVVATDAFEEATSFQQAAAALGVSHVIVFNELTTACGWLGVELASIRVILGELRRELRG